MAFSVAKRNGNILFRDFGGFETRNSSTMWCILEADKIYKWKDFDEKIIHTEDSEKSDDDYSYSKQSSLHKIVPDFTFHAWPQTGISDYNDVTNEMDTLGRLPFTTNKVGWIGNSKTNFRRGILLEIASKNKDILDIIDMSWSDSQRMRIDSNDQLGYFLNHTRSIPRLESAKYMSLPDLVQTYSILIDIEGSGWSARLKFLLWSHRPVLIVDRPHKEWFFEKLKEWVHYVPVQRDLSDLVEKTKWCLDNYEEAKKIAENAYEFAKLHLTREACYKQWDTILNVSY
jgi:glycosyltransferase involved in cell wall biosynthesis